VSNEFKWRPLGSVVNGVLQDVKLRAVRSGSISAAGGVREAAGGGGRIQAAQLELPFGITEKPAQPGFGTPRAPRGVRLM
jgi:hypothetical protein